MGSPKSPLGFSGRGGTAKRVSFAACGETKDTELVTTKRAVRFYSWRGRSAKHSLGRALRPRKKL